MNPISNIIHREFNEKPYNILLILSPDCIYDWTLMQTGHNFYTMTGWQGRENWGRTIDKPQNLQFFLKEFPLWFNADFVLCHGRVDEYNMGEELAHNYHVPLVCINDVCSDMFVKTPHFGALVNRMGNVCVFNSENIRESWKGFGAVIPPGLPECINSRTRKASSSVLALFPQNKPQEEILKMIDKEFRVEFLCGSTPEDLAKQFQESLVFLDINGPQFYTSSLWALACGCQLVSPTRAENKQYSNTNIGQSLGDLMRTIQNKLENPTVNSFTFNSLDNYIKDMNGAFDVASKIMYER